MTDPAGLWNGHHVEVVYNPARHDVMPVHGAAADDIGDNDLEHVGYQFVATDGQPGSGTATASQRPAAASR